MDQPNYTQLGVPLGTRLVYLRDWIQIYIRSEMYEVMFQEALFVIVIYHNAVPF